jgi:hypothetical protein
MSILLPKMKPAVRPIPKSATGRRASILLREGEFCCEKETYTFPIASALFYRRVKIRVLIGRGFNKRRIGPNMITERFIECTVKKSQVRQMLKQVSRAIFSLVLVSSLLSLSIVTHIPVAQAQSHTGGPFDPNAPALFDNIPNWGLNATNTALRSGPWNSATTWSAKRVPNAADIVLVPAGRVVTLDGDTDQKRRIAPTARTLVVSGTLRFSKRISTRLIVSTMLVRPDGTLDMSADGPLPPSLFQRILFRPSTYTQAEDPAQHANGLLVLGKWVSRGAHKTSYTRLAAAPRAGQTTLTFAAPVTGWQAGDKIAIPDTRSPYTRAVTGRPESWTETATVASVAGDGLSVRLNTALRYNHDGSTTRPGESPFLPHALNLTRNIELVSEQPRGVRGHVLAGGEAASVDIEDVAFTELGRTRADALHPLTNRIGRYSLHFHHCTGPFNPLGSGGYRARVIGCAFDASPKWHVAIHGTSKVRLEKNALLGAVGAAVVTEDGNERDNEIVGNIAVGSAGVGEPEPGTRADKTDFGSDGAGFWLSNNANLVTDNIAADCGLAGLMVYQHHREDLRFPMSPEDRSCCFVSLAWPESDFVFDPVPFQRNEAYGSKHGIEFWKRSPVTLKDSIVWNNHFGLKLALTTKLIVDGVIARGAPTGTSVLSGWEPSAGVWSRYHPVTPVLRNLDTAGSEYGVRTLTPVGRFGSGMATRVWDVTVENSRFRNPVGIHAEADLHYKKYHVGPSRVYIRNCTFEQVSPAVPLRSIETYLIFGADQNVLVGDEIWVENYQGRPGDNWRLYYNLQAPNVIVPHSSPNYAGGNVPHEQDYIVYWDGTIHHWVMGLLEAGLTNAQAWTRYGKAFAGSVSPTTYRHPEIAGGFAQSVSLVASPQVQPLYLQGRTDMVSGTALSGFVYDQNDDERKIEMEVLVDGVSRGFLRADQYRADPNVRRTINYSWNYPASIRDGQVHEIRLVERRSRITIPGFPVRVRTTP